MKSYMEREIKYQLVPPHQDRGNSTEHAIIIFNNHFIAGLCSTDEQFPLQCLCRLLAQVELTINLLRPSRLNPRLFPYAQITQLFIHQKYLTVFHIISPTKNANSSN